MYSVMELLEIKLKLQMPICDITYNSTSADNKTSKPLPPTPVFSDSTNKHTGKRNSYGYIPTKTKLKLKLDKYLYFMRALTNSHYKYFPDT